MSSLDLQSPSCDVKLIDEGREHRSLSSALRKYSKKYRLSDEKYSASSRHGVVVNTREGAQYSCLVLGFGGATGIHEHSAVVVNDHIFMAVGNQICNLLLPTLDLEWHTEVDWATCFGVYFSQEHYCLISHGELTIARLSLSGEIEWSVSGKDIFTGDLSLFTNHVEIIDFNQESYRIEIPDGNIQLLTSKR